MWTIWAAIWGPMNRWRNSHPAFKISPRAFRALKKNSIKRLTARGTVHVLEILHALGHGLDEAATEAAMAMRFPRGSSAAPCGGTEKAAEKTE